MTYLAATNRRHTPIRAGRYLLLPGVTQRVDLDFLANYGQIPGVEYDFSPIANNLVGRREDGSIQIDWRSPLSAVDGYGRHAIWLIRALQARGVDIKVFDNALVDNNFLPQDIREMRRQSFNGLPSKIGVSFTLGYDPAIYNHPSPIKIAITQFETNRLPRAHVANINRCDHVIVTSRFNREVFAKSGVTIPISSMTPGIQTADFPYMERPKDGLFKVLMLGALTPRKNVLAAIRIFQAASQSNPDWRFTIKTRKHPHLDDIRSAAYTDPRITVIVGDTSPVEVLNYYRTHDVLLWPSKGEGVGLPPLEAMATGMELVCAMNSGMMDYLHNHHAYPIKCNAMESAVGPGVFEPEYVEAYGDVGSWWLVDEKDGTRQLKRCFKDWYDGKGKGHIASEYVHSSHDVSHSAYDIMRILERFA